MTKNEAISSISNSLINCPKIFDSSFQDRLQVHAESKDEKNDYLFLYFPKYIPLNQVDGLKLKDDKGFITIQETFKFLNRHDLVRVGYTYRYITNEVTYTCEHALSGSTQNNMPYNFHYDMDLEYRNPMNDNVGHPPNHLQVLHNHPRFESPNMTTASFLATVLQLCFKGNKLDPHTEPIFIRK